MMFGSVSEHLCSSASGPNTDTTTSGGGVGVGMRDDSSASSWISMLSSVSRPAWSVLHKYLPRISQTWSSIDFGHHLMAGLDNLVPCEPSHPHLRVTYCQHEHDHDGFLSSSGQAQTLSWLTPDSLTDLAIHRTFGMNFNTEQTVPVDEQVNTGYLESTRKLLSQALAPKQHAEPMQTKLGVWYQSPTTPDIKTWWWQGLWYKSGSVFERWSALRSKTFADPETKHCCERSAVALDEAGRGTGPEKTRSECIGPSTDHASFHTSRLELFQNAAREHGGIVERQVGTRTVAACCTVSVLTPDQDSGYASLEEESARVKQCNMNPVCELLDLGSSVASQPGDHGHGGEEDKSAGNTHGERVENKEEEKEEEEKDVQNAEPTIASGAFAAQFTPQCQNKAIAYIMGNPCSDESDAENGSVRDSDDDDDGFDSDLLDDSEDLEDSDDEDDEDEEDSESNELDSDNEKLWNSLCQARDPYNPRNFTATIRTSQKLCSSAMCNPVGSPVKADSLLCSSSSSSPPSLLVETQKDVESSEEACSSTDEAESLRLWNSFSCSSDPYNPLNFQASVRTHPPTRQRCKKVTPVEPLLYQKDEAEERMDSGFSETATVQGFTSTGVVRLKKVMFIEEVEEFYASSDEERRGPWEEYARDRCRFQRRVQEVDESISYCLSPSFRLNVFERLHPNS